MTSVWMSVTVNLLSRSFPQQNTIWSELSALYLIWLFIWIMYNTFIVFIRAAACGWRQVDICDGELKLYFLFDNQT